MRAPSSLLFALLVGCSAPGPRSSATLAAGPSATASAPASPRGGETGAARDPLAVRGEALWVFVVSVLEWRDARAFHPFPKEGRRDARLVELFTRDKGVPPTHVVWLKDTAATLGAIRSELRALLGRTQPGDTLVLYYAGHGARRAGGVTYFIPNDARAADLPGTALATTELVKLIEEGFRGATALVAADCCFSGALCQAAQAGARRVAYGCFASAQSSLPSTEEWTFSDALLLGLRGGAAADPDRDGRVRFGELARYIEGEMAFEGQLSASATAGALDERTPLASVGPGSPPADERVVVRWRDGKDYSATVLGACITDAGEPGKRVHYRRYGSNFDECAPATSLRPFAPEPQRWKVGAKLHAEWDGAWYGVTVTEYRQGLYAIHYDGWPAFWDEWVGPARLLERAPCAKLPCRVTP